MLRQTIYRRINDLTQTLLKADKQTDNANIIHKAANHTIISQTNYLEKCGGPTKIDESQAR